MFCKIKISKYFVTFMNDNNITMGFNQVLEIFAPPPFSSSRPGKFGSNHLVKEASGKVQFSQNGPRCLEGSPLIQ